MPKVYLSRDRVIAILIVLLVSAGLGVVVFRSALAYENGRVSAQLERDLVERASALVRGSAAE